MIRHITDLEHNIKFLHKVINHLLQYLLYIKWKWTSSWAVTYQDMAFGLPRFFTTLNEFTMTHLSI